MTQKPATNPNRKTPMADFTVDWFNTEDRPSVFGGELHHLKGKPNLRVLEIGCYEGRGTLWFLSTLASHKTARVTCVDAWAPFAANADTAAMQAVERRFDKNITTSGQGRKVEKIKSDSIPALAGLLASGRKFDVVYVDGSHQAAQATTDIMLSWRLLYPDGYMLIDDYGSGHQNHAGLKPAVDAWLKEVTDATICHAGYTLVVKRQAKGGLVKVQQAQTPRPVFYCQVYKDAERLDWCLNRFRKVYPFARCYIVSDGDDSSPWLDVCAKYDCEYHAGERLKLLHNGGQMLHRNLSLFFNAAGTHLVKFDTDTAWHRQFTELPTATGMYGTVQYSDPPKGHKRLRSIQGGCFVWTADAVQQLVESQVLLQPQWANPSRWGGDVGSTGKYVKRTGLISEDWVLGEACKVAGVPLHQYHEVHCLWQGVPDWKNKKHAATHPHKNNPELEL